VIVKVKNTEVKINIMRKKKNLKKDFRFHDDITQSNLGLMARLKRSEIFENVWFYNCNVYAKLAEGSRNINITHSTYQNSNSKTLYRFK
jgi:hypothetical protein